jgi:hypothetical protein
MLIRHVEAVGCGFEATPTPVLVAAESAALPFERILETADPADTGVVGRWLLRR